MEQNLMKVNNLFDISRNLKILKILRSWFFQVFLALKIMLKKSIILIVIKLIK